LPRPSRFEVADGGRQLLEGEFAVDHRLDRAALDEVGPAGLKNSGDKKVNGGERHAMFLVSRRARCPRP
jgi:hypothetical protein